MSAKGENRMGELDVFQILNIFFFYSKNSLNSVFRAIAILFSVDIDVA